MTLRYITSFEQLPGDKNTSGADAMMNALGWSTTSAQYWDAPVGRRTGTKAVGVPQNGGANADWSFDFPVVFGVDSAVNPRGVGYPSCTLYMGIAVHVPSANPTSYSTALPTFQLLDALGGSVGGVYLNGTSGTQLVGGVGSVAAGTTTRCFPSVGWYFVELAYRVDTNVLTVWVDGVLILSSSISGTTSGISRFTFNAGNGIFYALDDVYLCDSTGSNNLTRLGDCRVEYCDVSALGTNQTWDAVGANALSAVTGSDVSDASFIRSTGVGALETFALNDLAVTPTTILGVQVSNIAQREAGTGLLGGAVRVAGSTYTTSPLGSIPKTGAYVLAPGIMENAPAGGAWTKAQIDAMEAGPVVIS